MWDEFIRLSDWQMLDHAGRTSHNAARKKAECELKTCRAVQDALPMLIDRNFAKAIEELEKIEGEPTKIGRGRREAKSGQ